MINRYFSKSEAIGHRISNGLVVFSLLLLSLCSAEAVYAGEIESYDDRFDKLLSDVAKHPDSSESVWKLHRAFDILGIVSNPEKATTLCRKLHRGAKTSFELRQLAALQLWREARISGEADRMRRALDTMGVVSRWRIIGPFDNEGGLGHDVAYLPEEGYDPESTIAGKRGPVRWRDFPDVTLPEGFLDFRMLYAAAGQAVGYAYAKIYSPKAKNAVLLMSASGSLKVWLNDRPAGAWAEDRPPRRWQSAYRVRLKKGLNEILVKVGGRDRGWGFRISVLDRKGRPIKDLRGIRHGDDFDAVAFPDTPKKWKPLDRDWPEPMPMAQEALEKKLERKPKASLALAVSYLHERRHAYSRESKLDEEFAQRALKLAPDDPEILLWCSKVFDNANRRLDCLLHGRKTSPDDPRISLRLARLYRDKGFELKARNLLDGIKDHRAVDIGASHSLSSLYKRKDLDFTAYELLQSVYEKHPGVSYVLRIMGKHMESMGRDEEAYDFYTRLYETNKGLLSTLRWIYGFHSGRMQSEEALKWLDRMIALYPGKLHMRMSRAELLEGLGRIDEARDELENTLEISPSDNTVLDRLAAFLHRHGNSDDARLLWEKSLAVHPQNPSLKRYLRLLEPDSDSFEKAYARNAEELVAIHAPHPEKGEPAEELIDQTVWKVFDNGLSSMYQQTVIRVYDEMGVKSFRRFGIRYSPDRQDLRILKARIIKPDGSIARQYRERDSSLNETYKIYFDTRIHSIEFSGLAPGDVVELQYRIDDISVENLFADYFGAMRLIHGRIPIACRNLTVLMPKDKTLYYNSPKSIPEPAISEKENHTEYLWKLENVPKIKNEPNSPPLVEIADYLHFSTFNDWEKMGSWYWGLVRDQFTAKDALKAKVRELIDGIEDAEGKIRAIYNWVVLNTRYVGLEFGIHSFKPYQVNDIFERKFGDCKDKATLMITMLKEAGIRAELAIIRTNNLGKLDSMPPSLEMFNHAIVYLPDQDLYLDGTAEFSGMYELPFLDRQGQVMLVSDDSVRFVAVPPSDPDANTYHQNMKVRLGDDGSAQATNRIEVRGTRASRYRRHFQDAKRRREMLEKLINKDHPGAVLNSFDFKSLNDLNLPVGFVYEAQLPDFIRKDGNNWAVRSSIDRVDLVKKYAPLSKREYPVRIDRLQTLVSTISFDLNDRFHVSESLKETKLNESFAEFTRKVEQTEFSIKVTTTLKFKKNIISIEEYPAFRRFCTEVTRAFNEEIRLSDAR